MRHVNGTQSFEPAGFMPDVVGVRVRAAYLGSRWVQAPIGDRREADT